MKKVCMVLLTVLCIFSFTGCGENEQLDQYQEDMTAFFEHLVVYNDGMNSLDTSAPDAKERMLEYLDKVRDEITWMAELEVPQQFSAVESLADEADENMKQAVAFFHQAYEAPEFDVSTAEVAKAYYDRANIRIQYIITILHGQIPEGEGVTYTEQNSILGEGYLNKTDKESTEENEVESQEEGSAIDGTSQSIEDLEPVTDEFDTDDTVFYEEPAE